ncbi:MAG: ATP-binding cassette domain-containing protein, partial [Candidatus Onthovivens sp.]|nr:ATP-binding cassette domain-containing protein [Candidatus Onthovivens sp.]
MIQVKHLSKSYKRKNKTNVILKNVNITLFDVGLVYIIGPSGCGKSTLLNIFEGIDNDYEGDVFINDTNIRKLKGKEKRMFFKNNIGIVSQASNLFESLTVYQNLLLTCYIKGINKSIIDEYLKKYKLEKLKNHKVSTLSGGEKQRISLIRAIINKPKIIFADEPTGALDKDNAQILMDELYELSKTTLVIVVTHNLNLINEYKGSIIEIKDKEVEIKENLTINTNYVRYSKLVKEKDYSNLFIDSGFKSNKAKNIISFISLFVGLFLIFGSFSLNEGFNLNRDTIYEKNINSNVVKIYKNDYEDISKSKLSLVKKKRPSIENIQTFLCSFENINIYYNFDFYITN